MSLDSTEKLNEAIKRLQTGIAEVLKQDRNNVVMNVTTELKSLESIWSSQAGGWAKRLLPGQWQAFTLALSRAEVAVAGLRNAGQRPEQMDAELTRARAELASAVAQAVALGMSALSRDDDAIEKLEAAAQKALVEWNKKFTELTTAMTASLEEARRVAELATSAAARVGISEKVTEFANARDSHRGLASRWACAGVGTAVALLAAVWCRAGDRPPTPEGMWYLAGNLSFYLPRALIVSIFSWLIVFCAGNFRAAKHNEVINGHRAGALATYERMAAAFKSPTTETMALYVAEAVFGAQPSGYSDVKMATGHLGEVVEAVKGLRGE